MLPKMAPMHAQHGWRSGLMFASDYSHREYEGVRWLHISGVVEGKFGLDPYNVAWLSVVAPMPFLLAP